MSISRLFILFVALALVVGVVFTINGGIVTSKVMSGTQAALDQHERHSGFLNPSAASAAAAEQARLGYRLGEGHARKAAVALDHYARHPSLPMPDNRTCVLCGGQ